MVNPTFGQQLAKKISPHRANWADIGQEIYASIAPELRDGSSLWGCCHSRALRDQERGRPTSWVHSRGKRTADCSNWAL